MPSKFHEKIVEPLERAVAEMKGYAEGATGVPPGTGSASSHAAKEAVQTGAQKLAKSVLPESAQEFLGIKKQSFLGRSFSFAERNILGRPLVFVAFPLILGLFLSSWVHKKIRTNRAAYDKISLPRNVPPSWLYDPMWTVVLCCMGYASWIIYHQGGFGEWLSLSFYNFSIFLLISWPVLFFGYPDNQLLPAICSSLLTLNVFITLSMFYAKSAVAGSLMIPALLWIGYLMILNWQIFSLNKGKQKFRIPGLKGKEEQWPWSTTQAATTATGATTTEAREGKKMR
jgi:tryptophan-rich sensory protein